MLAETEDVMLQVLHAARLEAGLAMLQREQIAVILLDLSLPDSLGLETFQTMHQHAGGIPIIVLTGSRDRELALRAIQEGAQDYLVKDDVRPSELSRAIHYAVERKYVETRLRESENRYKTLVNSVPDAILLIRNDRIVHCNEPATALFGLSFEQLLGRDPATLSPPRQADGSLSAPRFREQIRETPSDGRLWFEWRFQ